MPTKSNPHDVFIRGIFKQPDYAREFLSIFLPIPILENVDIQNLKLDDTSFVNERFKEFHSDILFEVPFKTGKSTNIYFLFEHKSNPDYDILLQLLRYQTEIYTRTKGLIPIICLVFYHSNENWTIPQKFSEKLKLGDKISVFKEYILDFKYLLFDIEKEKMDRWELSLKLKIIFLLLKEVRKQDFNENKLKEIIRLGKEVFLSRDGLDLLKRIIIYIYYTTNIKIQDVKEILNETITEERTKEAMTTAERLIYIGEYKGKLEGELKGKLETAFNMLKLNIPEDIVLQATGLSKSDLLKKVKNGVHYDKQRVKRENHKIALKTALEMWKSEFDVEIIASMTNLDANWLNKFFKRV